MTMTAAAGGFVLSERPHSSPLELVDVEGEFEGGAELQAHVLHHHVAAQQQEGLAVNLLERTEGRKEGGSDVGATAEQKLHIRGIKSEQWIRTCFLKRSA